MGALVAAGNTLFVATTKPTIYADRIVEYFEMGAFFKAVYGSELDGTRVDKTELLAWALPQNGVGRDAIMVGDRKHDIVGALNNGMMAFGVAYGYGSIAELEASGAHGIVAEPSELPGVLS